MLSTERSVGGFAVADNGLFDKRPTLALCVASSCGEEGVGTFPVPHTLHSQIECSSNYAAQLKSY